MAEIITDSFDRADGALGANWLAPGSWAAPTIASNQVTSTAAEQAAVFTGAGWTGGADHYVEVTMKASGGGSDCGPCARCATVTFNTFYYFAIPSLGSSDTHQLHQVVSQSFTPIGTPFSGTINVGDVVRIEAEGTTIRGKVNGVTVTSATDSGIASGNPGIFMFDGGTNPAMDDFAAGDFTAAPTRRWILGTH